MEVLKDISGLHKGERMDILEWPMSLFPSKKVYLPLKCIVISVNSGEIFSFVDLSKSMYISAFLCLLNCRNLMESGECPCSQEHC